MCETCGCGDPDLVSVEIQESLLSVNDRAALQVLGSGDEIVLERIEMEVA